MTKTLLAALAIAGAACLTAPANAAPQLDGVKATTAVHADFSARRHHRHWRSHRYVAPTYSGYYGPTYYDRPYHRPPAVVFGLGGWW